MTSPAEFDGLPQFVQELQMFSEILEETKGLIARDLRHCVANIIQFAGRRCSPLRYLAVSQA